jgi:hypothetical protein
MAGRSSKSARHLAYGDESGGALEVSKPSNKEKNTVFSSKLKHRFALFVKGY